MDDWVGRYQNIVASLEDSCRMSRVGVASLLWQSRREQSNWTNVKKSEESKEELENGSSKGFEKKERRESGMTK